MIQKEWIDFRKLKRLIFIYSLCAAIFSVIFNLLTYFLIVKNRQIEFTGCCIAIQQHLPGNGSGKVFLMTEGKSCHKTVFTVDRLKPYVNRNGCVELYPDGQCETVRPLKVCLSFFGLFLKKTDIQTEYTTTTNYP